MLERERGELDAADAARRRRGPGAGAQPRLARGARALDRVHRRRLRGDRRLARAALAAAARKPGRDRPGPDDADPARARADRAVHAHALDRGAEPSFQTCNIVYPRDAARAPRRLRRGVHRGARRGHRPRLAGARDRRRHLGRAAPRAPRRRRLRPGGHPARGAAGQRLRARLPPPPRAARKDAALGRLPQPAPAPARARARGLALARRRPRWPPAHPPLLPRPGRPLSPFRRRTARGPGYVAADLAAAWTSLRGSARHRRLVL